jgi:hypothetical protein
MSNGISGTDFISDVDGTAPGGTVSVTAAAAGAGGAAAGGGVEVEVVDNIEAGVCGESDVCLLLINTLDGGRS